MAIIGYLIFALGLGVVAVAIWTASHPRPRERAIYRELPCGCRYNMPNRLPDRRCHLCEGRGFYRRRVR